MGDVLGTPSYMAPEQAAGDVKNVGPSADIYALGAILYESLTGRPPFRGATRQQTVKQVLHEEVIPPSRLQPGTPRDLETICLKCLRKEPQQRYASAQALAEDARRFLNGEPICARPVSRAERLWRWCKRKPAVASLSAGMIVVILGALSATTALWLHADKNAAAAQSAAAFEGMANAQAQRRLRELEKANEILRSVFSDLAPRSRQ